MFSFFFFFFLYYIVYIVGIMNFNSEFAALVERMATFYREDVRGDVQTNAGLLNRVFQGPPGTGKTTVAKLYGRLLAACGFLTDGEVVCTLPKDFLGAVLGESEKKTDAIIESCRGKVLLIDEAYGMANKGNSFYEGVIGTLVGAIPEKGGMDMAVIMCG